MLSVNNQMLLKTTREESNSLQFSVPHQFLNKTNGQVDTVIKHRMPKSVTL